MKIFNYELDGNKAMLIGEMLLLFFCFFIPGLPFSMAGYIIAALPQILLLIYLLRLRNDLPLSDFGIFPPITRDILFAFLHAFVLFLIYLFMVQIISWLPERALDYLLPAESPELDDGSGGGLLLLFCLVVGYREELFFRVYLLNRFRQLGVGRNIAVFSTALLFGLFHLYEGLLGFIFTFVVALYFSYIFIKTRRLHLIAISHGIFNAFMFLIQRLAA